jgi:putative Mn2+ efflux pump MntP
MEFRKRTIEKHYEFVHLFLDDLKRIDEILRNSTETIRYETDEYTFENVGELITHYENQTIKELNIATTEPIIYLRFMKDTVYLSTWDAETATKAIGYSLDETISSRVRPYKFITSSITFTIVTIFAILGHIYFTYDKNPYLLVSNLSFYILFIMATFLIKRTQSVKINIIARNQKTNFLKRNKDNLIVNAIVAVVSVLLTLLGTYLYDLKANYPSHINSKQTTVQSDSLGKKNK